MWGRADPVKEIDGLIDKHRADRAATQIELQVAIDRKTAALAAGQVAQDDIDRLRQQLRETNKEINDLLEERLTYVPAQRPCSN